MKLSEISQQCGYEFCGKDIDVTSIRYAESATGNDIAIIMNSNDLETTKASCLLMRPMIINASKSIIFTSDPIEFSAVKIARIIQKENIKEFTDTKYIFKDGYYLGKNVIIGENTTISPNVYIDDNVTIGNNCFISPNSHICSSTIIGDDVRIGSGSTIGAESFYHYYDDGLQEFEGIGHVVLEDEVSVGHNSIIQRGTFSDTVVGKRSKIGNLIDIGHDVIIGSDCKIVSQTGIASNVKIKRGVTIYGQVGIANNVCIGSNAVVYAKSLVTKNVKDNQHVSGVYAREHVEELRIQAKLKKL